MEYGHKLYDVTADDDNYSDDNDDDNHDAADDYRGAS